MGMGGACIVSSRGSDAIGWNPAGLAVGSAGDLVFTHARPFQLISFTSAGFTARLREGLLMGGGFQASGDDVLREHQLSVSLGYDLSSRIRGCYTGVGLRMKHAVFGDDEEASGNVSGHAVGYGVDLGVLVRVSPLISTGLVLRDVLNTVSWNSSTQGTYAQSVPARLVLGCALVGFQPVRVEVDWEKSLYSDTHDCIRVGAEAILLNRLFLRAGWVQDSAGEDPSYSAGLGVRLDRLRTADVEVDVAYSLHALGNTVYASLRLRLK